jgi:glutathione S-transferase
VLERKFAWVSGQLEGRKFLTGDEFTAADAYLFAIARWAPGMKCCAQHTHGERRREPSERSLDGHMVLNANVRGHPRAAAQERKRGAALAARRGAPRC